MSEWQPIETAPKDGSWIILWAKDHLEHFGDYPDKSLEYWVARWSNNAWRWYNQDDEVVCNDYEMTHWMPLPDPPQ
jgi:hypothetical protein